MAVVIVPIEKANGTAIKATAKQIKTLVKVLDANKVRGLPGADHWVGLGNNGRQAALGLSVDQYSNCEAALGAVVTACREDQQASGLLIEAGSVPIVILGVKEEPEQIGADVEQPNQPAGRPLPIYLLRLTA